MFIFLFFGIHDVNIIFNKFRDQRNADLVAAPVAAVEFLSKYCQYAVVTLGANGCIAKHGKEVRYVFWYWRTL